jgi:hypothetical protein
MQGVLFAGNGHPKLVMSAETSPKLAVIFSTPSEFEARTMAAALSSRGIEAFVFAAAAQSLNLPSTGGVQVAVREQDAPAALQALRQIRRESIDIDWDEVDVGEPEIPGDNLRPPRRRVNGFSPFLASVRSYGIMLLLASMLFAFVPRDAWTPFLAAMLVLGVVLELRERSMKRLPRSAHRPIQRR